MGRRNILIEGSSGSGKTSVCRELQRRGYHAINADRELAIQGDPVTGEPVEGRTGLAAHSFHIWPVARVRELVEDDREPITFFCGGSRNFDAFIHLFDAVFVLEVDARTLIRRLEQRAEDEWAGRGRTAERDLVLRNHETREELPAGAISIDATAPLPQVVDQILRRSGAAG